MGDPMTPAPDRGPPAEVVEDMAYVGICRCGAIRAACVDERKTKERQRDVAKFCAEIVRDGLTLERVTCQAVREGRWQCSERTDQDCAVRLERKEASRAAKRAEAQAKQGTLL